MILTVSLLTLLLALSITGSPVEVRNSPIILPLTRRLNFSNGTIDLVQHDKAGVAAFRDYHTHSRRAESIPMIFSDGDKYTVTLGVGSPLATYDLAVDCGSAVTWIGARNPYDETGVNTGQGVRENYGGLGSLSAFFSGTIFRDTVTLGGGLTISDYELAVASTVKNIRYYDGILGMGPRALTVETLTGKPDTYTYPTFTECLVNENVIGHNLVGIFLRPITEDQSTHIGELTFGEIDYSKCAGNIIEIPITDTYPSSNYWGIKQSITYGDTVILGEFSGIVDTGSKYISFSSAAYYRYQAATGATLDRSTNLLRITTDQYRALQDLEFHMEDAIFRLTPNAQIWPRSLNHRLTGGENDGIYLIIKHLHMETGTGFDFVLGYTFMQRFYTVLDGGNRKVGFATTSFTSATTN